MREPFYEDGSLAFLTRVGTPRTEEMLPWAVLALLAVTLVLMVIT